MKRFTLILSLMVAMVTTAMAQEVTITEGLPGNATTIEGGGHTQYTWTSEQMTASSTFNALRITFLSSEGSCDDKAGYPFVAISEFYLYDKDGNVVTLNKRCFGSNATETKEGGIEKLCDGVTTGSISKYDWYWHSTWSSSGNPAGNHYLMVYLHNVNADLSKYSIGWVTRQQNAAPESIKIEELNVASDGIVIEEETEFSNNKVYTFKSGRGEHYLLYHTDAPDNLSSTYSAQGHAMDYSSTTANFQFAVYKFQEKYYMFNIEAQKFVGNNDNSGAIPLVELPTNSIEFRTSNNAIHNFVISTNGTGALNLADSENCHGVINWSGGYNNLSDAGNIYLITEVGDLDEELATIIEERLNTGIIIAAAQAIVDGASDTRVGAYTKATVVSLKSALTAYENEASVANLEAVKTALSNVETSGEKVTLSANEIFTVKCVEDARGYMVYSTVEGKGSETQVYLAETPYVDQNTSEKYHPGIADEGVYKEWAMVVNNGKNYIYNVQKKQFISADGVVQFTDSPAALKLIEIEDNLHEIQFESNNKYLSFSPGWGANCVRTEPGVDNGCKFYLDKTGETASIDAIIAVETTFVNGWKEAALSTLDYVGGYPSTLEASINAVNTLAGTTEFDNANVASRIQLTPGYYFVKQVSTGKYASYNADDKFATETVEKLGIKHVLKFVQDGENIKLQVPNLGKNVSLENADANGGSASTIVDGGSNFTVEINNSANVIIKGGDKEMRTEKDGEINYWWGDTNTTWNIIPANDIEISVNEFASLYLPFAVSVEGATACAVEETASTYAILAEKNDIPAMQGAILAADGEATVTLNIIDNATSDWTNNKLQGSTTDTYVEGVAYVLANGADGIGLYKTTLNRDEDGNDGTTHFKNNANKAYLVVPASEGAEGIASYSFRFGEETTGISEVKGESGNVKVIFDLTGRRVENPSNGIYIINGVKVLVK